MQIITNILQHKMVAIRTGKGRQSEDRYGTEYILNMRFLNLLDFLYYFYTISIILFISISLGFRYGSDVTLFVNMLNVPDKLLEMYKLFFRIYENNYQCLLKQYYQTF